MATELNGPGHIAGESLGGSGANLNERPDNSTPGGSSHGNTGNHDPNSASSSAAGKQIAAVKSDPKVRQKLADLIKRAKAINPNAHLSITKLSQNGEMTIQIDGLTVDQTSAIGLGGIITITGTDGPHSFGSFDTGHKIGNFSNQPDGNNGSAESLAENKTSVDHYASVIQGTIPKGFWVDNEKVMTEVNVPFETNVGGKGNPVKGSRKENVEVKSLTEAYKNWKKIKAEIAEEARKALFDKAGIQDTPVYTPEMVKAANAMLAAPAAMMFNRAPAGIQLSAVGEGVITAVGEWAGSIAGALWRGAVAVAEAATASTAGATVGAFVVGFMPLPAGHSSDSKVPGRDISMMAAQARLFTAGKVSIEPGMKSINLPVRGFISTDSDGRQSVNFVKTGTGGVSATVQVLSAVRDKVTGLDKITVPAVAGAPSRTILVNPVPVGPAAPLHTGNNTSAPVTPVHTGTEVKQADSIVTTTFPAADTPSLQDFIYWQPDATGTGVEPIYVMLSDPLDSGRFTRRQLQKKYKHAIDFGISDTRINSDTLTKFRDAVEAHLSDKNTIVKGTYIREKDSKVYFNTETNNAVVIRKDGLFSTGMKLKPGTPQYKNYIDKGVLL